MGNMEHAKETEGIVKVVTNVPEETVATEITTVSEKSKITRFSEKLKEKKHIIVICSIVLIMLFLGISFYSMVITKSAERMIKDVGNPFSGIPMERIAQGEVLSQEFATENDIMIGFSLKYFTYLQQNSGSITVSLTDSKTGKEVFSQVQPLNEIADGDQKTYMFKNTLFCEKGDKFTIKISADNLSSTDKFTLDKNTDKFSFITYCGYHSFIKPVYLISLVGFIAFAGLIYYLVFMRRIKIEKIFVLTMSFFGVIYMFLIPPMSAPDDGSHFNSIYGYSNVLLGKSEHPTQQTMRRVDAEFDDFQMMPSLDIFRLVLKGFFDSADSSEMATSNSVGILKVDTTGTGAPAYLYIPSILGMTLGRLMHLGTIPLYYLTRAFALAFFIVITYYGMKKMPFGKPILFAICILPITIQQSMSYSYDVTINGLSFFYIAYCLYVAFGKQKIKLYDIAILSIVSILLASCKSGTYFLICLLCIIIPRTRFSTLKNYYISICVILTCALGSFLRPLISTLLSSSEKSNSGNFIEWAGESGYTLGMLLENPVETIRIFINTFVTKGDFYLSSTIGFLGWFLIPISAVVTTGFVILLVMSTLYEKNELNTLKIGHKALVVVIILGVVGLAEVGMLLNWTPLSYKFIEGVQGRYFLPILPLFLLLFKTKNVTARNEFYRIPVYSTYILQFFAIGEIIRKIF